MKKEKNKKNIKKKKRIDIPHFDTEEEKLQFLQKQMEEILTELKKSDSEISQDITKRMKKRQLLMFFVDYLFVIGLIFGISGYIYWAEFSSIWMTLMYSAITILIDLILTLCLYFVFPKLIMLTFGLITILTLPISLIAAIFITPGLEVVDLNKTILFIVILLIVRGIVKVMLASKKILLKVKR